MSACLTVSAVFGSASLISANDIETARSLVETGQFEQADSLLATLKDPERFLWRGRIAFMNYDFPAASKFYTQYRKALGKAHPAAEAETFSHQLELANQALSSVAAIEVVDSLTVPTVSFLNAYRLPASAGRLAEPDALPFEGSREVASSAFFNERGDFALWAEPDTLGVYRITEATRLTDGSWSAPRQADDILNNGGDVDYPFMCADGTTLYFASDGEESMGGYDIFVATRDASDGEYLKPRNIGMPFNSPFDDYMMAIDEENGIGWWATDRNRLADRLTIYIYILEDARENVDFEDEEIPAMALARLSDISLTQDDDTDYAPLRRRIASIRPATPPKAEEFRFQLPGGRVYTAMSDFRSQEARRIMAQYVKTEKEADSTAEMLSDLRRKYHSAAGSAGRNAVSREILTLEDKTESLRKTLTELRNRIYSAELGL